MAHHQSICFLIISRKYERVVTKAKRTKKFCGEAVKTLGLCPKPCKGLLERSPLTARTLTQLDFGFCFYVVQILSVAIFRAANSGCSEPNPVQRDLCSCRFSPLPDKSGRKLVDGRSGATHVLFRLGCVLLWVFFLDFVGFDRRLRHKMRVNALQNRCKAVYFVRNNQKDGRKYAKILCHIGK